MHRTLYILDCADDSFPTVYNNEKFATDEKFGRIATSKIPMRSRGRSIRMRNRGQARGSSRKPVETAIQLRDKSSRIPNVRVACRHSVCRTRRAILHEEVRRDASGPRPRCWHYCLPGGSEAAPAVPPPSARASTSTTPPPAPTSTGTASEAQALPLEPALPLAASVACCCAAATISS